MNKDEITALERRNKSEDRLIHIKLDSICKTVEENHRALRGSNGDAGLVADLEILKTRVGDMTERRTWVNRTVIGAALVVLVDIVFNLI